MSEIVMKRHSIIFVFVIKVSLRVQILQMLVMHRKLSGLIIRMVLQKNNDVPGCKQSRRLRFFNFKVFIRF